MKKQFFILVFMFVSCFGNTQMDSEISDIQKTVNKVSNSFQYGIGSMDTEFNDEIIKYGEGHCGHYSWVLLREFLKQGYSGEIISITTYNHRNHAMVEIERKTDYKKILVDATTNLVYDYSVEDILKNPLLSKQRHGRSKSPTYSNLAFWGTIKTIRYLPYIGYKTLDNIQNIKVDNPNIFYKKPNGLYASFDKKYNTYTATKMSSSIKVNFEILFKKQNRLSSIVIEPYDINTYPSKLLLKCMDNNQIIYNNFLKIKRSLLIVNIVEPKKQYCKKLKFEFSDFQGQDRLLIRDIYFYGK